MLKAGEVIAAIWSLGNTSASRGMHGRRENKNNNMNDKIIIKKKKLCKSVDKESGVETRRIGEHKRGHDPKARDRVRAALRE